MKTDKNLVKLINKLTEESFKDGILIESKVIKSIKLLKSGSVSQAIFSLSEYLKQLKDRQRQHTLYIETVITLSKEQLNKIKKIIGKKVKITKVITSINPEILGGIKLKVGDEIWDHSIKGKIEQIREAIVA